MKRLSLFICLALACISSGGQLQFKTLNTNDGLSQHSISHIIQDSEGYIWIGTYFGLNRFDGHRVKTYIRELDNEQSLAGNRIMALFEDSANRIWIGSDGNGFCFYSRKEDVIKRVKSPYLYEIVTGYAEYLGKIYAATSKGLMAFNEKEEQFEIVPSPLATSNIQKIASISDIGLFCTAENNLWYLIPGTNEAMTRLNSVPVSTLCADKDSVWFSSGRSLYAAGRNGSVRHFIQITGNALITSVFSQKEMKYIGTSDGLYVATGYVITHYGIREGLMNTDIRTLFIDKSNTLWIGTANGVYYTNLNRKKFYTLNLEEVQNRFIKTLFIDGQTLITCPYAGGIFKLDMQVNQLRKFSLRPEDEKLVVNDLKKFSDQSIYVASSLGLFRNSGPDRFERILFSGTYLYCLAEDRYGNRFYGTNTTIYIQPPGGALLPLSGLFPGNTFMNDIWSWCIYPDSIENCVWLGTIRKGIVKLNQDGRGRITSVETYNRESEVPYFLPDKHVWDIARDKKGNFWIGTDAGLFRKNEKGIFEQIKIPLLENQKVISIIEDDTGCLWLSCSDRLLWFNPENSEVKRYTHSDGLQSNTFTETSVKAGDGRIYIAGIDGVNYFYPEEIVADTCKPQVAINNIKVHNISIAPNDKTGILKKSVNQTDELVLTHKQNEFVLEFVALHFANPGGNSFRYILEGYDPEWITKDAQNNFAAYSNLPADSYTFRVQAANADKTWGDVHDMKVTILPSPWKTWWAYTLYTLIVLILIGILLYFLVTKQKLHHQVQINDIERKKEAELNEVKLMFFTNVAHEFKTPLSLIIGPVNDLLQNGSKDQLQQFCFNVISRNVKRLSLLVDQLLDFRTLNQGQPLLNVTQSDIGTCVRELSMAFEWQANRNNIDFNLKMPAYPFMGWFDPDKLNKVLFNILSNAFKNTPKGGKIDVEMKHIVHDAGNMVRISISDSGPGIDPADKKKVFTLFFHKKLPGSHGIGMHLAWQLVKAHKGTLEVADSVYNGSEFIVTLPVGREDYSDEEIFSQKENPNIHHQLDLLSPAVHPVNYPKTGDKILIVEDDHDLQEYLCNLLHESYAVFAAQNGREALEIVREKEIDIVISDVMMPEMDGVEMCRAIKQEVATSHIPVLLLTAKTDIEYQRIGLEAGAADYILKPFNSQTLALKIDNIVADRKRLKDSISEGRNNFVNISKIDRKILEDAQQVIHENIDNPDFDASAFCKKMNMSRMTLHKKLKALTGESTTEFIRAIKIKHSVALMESGMDRVNEIAGAIGMSGNYFLKTFKKEKGFAPSEYIRSKSNLHG